MKQIKHLAILAAGLLALTAQSQAGSATETSVQVAKFGGKSFKGGGPKTAINLKTILTAVGIADPKTVALVFSTCDYESNGSTVKRRVLALRKVPGGTLADDINLLDFSNVSDYQDPQVSITDASLDGAGLGVQLDGVSIRSIGTGGLTTSIFGSGSSLTTIKKGTPQQRIYDVSTGGPGNTTDTVLLFKVSAGKLYVPKP